MWSLTSVFCSKLPTAMARNETYLLIKSLILLEWVLHSNDSIAHRCACNAPAISWIVWEYSSDRMPKELQKMRSQRTARDCKLVGNGCERDGWTNKTIAKSLANLEVSRSALWELQPTRPTNADWNFRTSSSGGYSSGISLWSWRSSGLLTFGFWYEEEDRRMEERYDWLLSHILIVSFW
jgi:hypothetical protein